MIIEPSLQELVQAYKAIYPAAITDILDTDYQLRHQWLGREIKPLDPSMRIAGPAFTMRFVSDPVIVEDDEYELLTSRIVQELEPFFVPVLDTSKCTNAGFWGELMCTICSEKGVDGAVIDGGVRDPFFIYKAGFNMFATFACPLEANYSRARLESVQRPIYINDVRIRPGDFLVGDLGGVVCIPKEIVVELYEKVRKLVDQESETRRLIRSGASIKELMAAGGRL